MLALGVVITTLLFCLTLYDVLQMCQQNHYHYSFYKKWILKVVKDYDILVLLLVLLKTFFELNEILIGNIIIIILSIIYFVIWIKRKRIVKLKFTRRIKRIIFVMLIVSCLESLIINYNLIIILCLLNLYLSLVLLKPIEILISNYYKKKAKNKLNEIKPIIIGITGSAGKTSVKNFIYQLLKDEKVVFKSPKSYNTINGLSKAINEGLTIGTEVAILEFGASHKHDIDKLIRFIKPDIALVTNVLPQHLETFKCVENIMEEKFKLLKSSDVAILNTDIIDTILPDKIKKVTIGSKRNVDYKIENCIVDENGCAFKINGVSFVSSLVGKCNCENLLLSISTCLFLGIDIKRLVLSVKNLKSVENRLEIKDIKYQDKNIKIINDSFNSNIKGFTNALEVMSFYKGKKVIITPGIVEGGKRRAELNGFIAKKIMETKTDVYLIKSNVTKYYIDDFVKRGYDYMLFTSFVESFTKAKENYDVILVENDISDIYKY